MAGSPGGKSVGRVSIRVVPDSTRFKADLKKSLERIEKSTTFTLPLSMDTRDAELSLKKFQKDWNGRAVNLDVDATTAGATAKLKTFTRRRSIGVDVNLNNASLAKAVVALKALSGARVLDTQLRRMFDTLGELDTAIPRMASLALVIGSLGALALSSVGGLAIMIGSLSSLVALAAPLPGLFAAAAVAGVALFVALKDAGTQLKSLGPLWTRLGTIIRDNFWAKARQPILDLVNGVFPQLKAGLGQVSTALGVWAGSVAGSFQKAFGGGVLTGMMSKLAVSIKNSTKGTDAFAASIATLGTFASQYLPGIGTWFSDISVRFNGWLQQVAGNGVLAGWVSNAMIVLGQLGDVLKGVVGTISGIMTAASAAGGGGLSTIADAMLAISAAVNGPIFQGALTTIFSGAARAASALGTALGPIGDMLATLAPAIGTSLAVIGQTLADVVTGIANALNQPGFGAALQQGITGLMLGVSALVPAFAPLASMITSILPLISTLAQTIGPVLATAFQAVAPVVSAVVQAIQPLVPVLGGLLLQAIRIVSPLLTSLVPIFESLVPVAVSVAQAMGPLIDALGPILASLVPVIASVVTALEPLIGAVMPVLIALVQLLSPIIQQLAGVFTQIVTAVTPIIAAILPPLMSLFQALMPIVSLLINDFMSLLTPILQLIAPLLQLIGPILKPLTQMLSTMIAAGLKPLTPILQALSPLFSAVGQVIGDVLLPVVQMIVTVLGGLIKFLTGVFTGNWKQAWAGIVQIFSGVWNGIIGIARGVLNGLVDIINGMIGGVNAITGTIGIPAIPKIPHLATGADVEASAGGTLVVLGEGGKDETVTNRGLTNRMIEDTNELVRRILAGGIGAGERPPVNIYTQETDGRIIGRQAAREFVRALAGAAK